MLGVNNITASNRDQGLSALTICNVAFLIVHFIMWPYVNDRYNYLELFSLSILCFITAALNGEVLPLTDAATLGVSLLVTSPSAVHACSKQDPLTCRC